MYCDKCHKNPASVHVERIVNGAKTEYNLCMHCAAHERSDAGGDMSFDKMIKEFLGSIIGSLSGYSGGLHFLGPDIHNGQAVAEIPACQSCGVSFDELREEGKLGCVNCYKAFRPQIDTILKNVHGSSEHTGKTPKKAPRELILRREVETMKRGLREAIEREQYEIAAELRDKIRSAEAELYKQGAESGEFKV
ncbi:MAG: UvrB/UvrC motif-containing protein [Defluviitaleaceae bacterium]|nr:UvrB/UvrC motif-containing protein [Defluviitaleaceae bacterium]MCL2835393.1 UvrB/UvrC motif-containing protein [Defluviitaleaceae bacterium]